MGDFRRQADIATMHARSTDDALLEGLRHEKAALYGARRGFIIGLLAASVFLIAAVVLVVMFRAPRNNDPDACMREHAGFIDIKPSCPEPVSIDRNGDVILAHPGVSLEERGSGVRVRHGTASFVAQPRDGGDALRVLVSHGVISITGTRFTVVQNEGKGLVKVDEGTIVFHDDDGTDVTVTAGGELSWPRPPSAPVLTLDAIPLAPPKTATLGRAPRSGVAKASEAVPGADAVEEEDDEVEDDEPQPTGVMSMEDILKRISTLRRQKRQREAVELLVSQSQRGDITPAQMARLSWEIGLFLQDAGEKAAACNHWKNHARKYPDDAAHAERVRELIKGCETRP